MLPRALDVSAFHTHLVGYNSLPSLVFQCECAKELQFDVGISAWDLRAKKAPIEPEFSAVPNQAWRAWCRSLLLPQAAQISRAPRSFPISLLILLSLLLVLLLPVRIQPLTQTFHLVRFLRVQASPLRDAFHWSVPVVLDQSPFQRGWKIQAPGELILQ